jgi:hypothetical protein
VSFFEDQYEAWEENGYQGTPDMYEPYSPDVFGAWVDNPPSKKHAPEPNKDENALLKKLIKAADGKGLKCSCHGNGHFQVRAGRKIINWYPYSRRKTVYDNLTGEKRFGLSVEKVIAFALEREVS